MSRRPRFQDDEYPDRDEPRGNRAGAPPTPPPARDPDDHRSNRKSILVDPDEDPKDKAARRHSRSNSQVRIKPPASNYHSSDDEGSVRGHYVKHRNGQVEFIMDGDGSSRKPDSKRRTHDLESKTADSNRNFRDKRNGYESDEGEQLKKIKRHSRRDSVGDNDNTRIEKPKGRSAWEGANVRSRGKDSREDNAFVIPDRTRRDHADGMGAGKRREMAHRRYDSDSDDEYPPRRQRSQRKAHESDLDRGYDTEGARRRRRGWDDEDKDYKQANRRSARFDDGYEPTRRAPPRDDRLRPPRNSRYEDVESFDRKGRDRDRRDNQPIRRARSDAKPRDRERYGDRRDPRDKRQEWAKQAGALFMTQAMPVIKREGGKWAKRELENYFAQRK